MGYYERLQNWYTRKGISTEQFFRDTSTELGRASMEEDFVIRHLQISEKEADELNEIDEGYEKERRYQMGSSWFKQSSQEMGLDWREQIARHFFRRGWAVAKTKYSAR